MRLFEIKSMNPKVILTDVDGVLLDRDTGFINYMHDKGFVTQPGMDNEYYYDKRFGKHHLVTGAEVKKYNASDKIKSLPPMANAVEYVKKLASEGYTFYALTALSDNPEDCDYRRFNLQNVFGKDIFPDSPHKWFIVVAILPDGQISNHYKEKEWELFKIPETKMAKFPFDGHTSSDVLLRLENSISDIDGTI